MKGSTVAGRELEPRNMSRYLGPFGGSRLVEWLVGPPTRPEDPAIDEGRRLTRSLVLLFVLPFSLFFLVASVEGTRDLPGANVGLMEDGPFLVLLLSVAVAIHLAGRVIRRGSRLFTELREAGLVASQEEEEREFHEELQQFVLRRPPHFLTGISFRASCIVVAFVYAVPYVVFLWPYAWHGWHNFDHKLGYAAVTVYLFVIIGVVAFEFAWRIVGVIAVVREVFRRFEIRINVFSRPGSAGLRSLGETAFSLDVILAVLLVPIVASAMVWGVSLGAVLSSMIYLPMLTAVFFLPLLPAHRAMAEAKRRELRNVDGRLAQMSSKMVSSDSSSEQSEPASGHDNQSLSALLSLKQAIEGFSTWPIDVSLFAKFLTTLVLPIALIVIEVYLR